MSYHVRYKKFWWPFWRRVLRVKGDDFYGAFRALYLENGGLLLLPTQGVLFEFGPERAAEQRAKAGQVKQPRPSYPVRVGWLSWQVVEEIPTPTPTGHVALLLADDRRLELPPSRAVRFEYQRAQIIARQMEQEAGLPLRLT